MGETIKDVADSFRTYEQMYDELIEKGYEAIPLCLDNDGIWKRVELKWMLEHFTEQEEYEKCAHLWEIIDGHYIAPDEKQAELNRKLELYKTLFK